MERGGDGDEKEGESRWGDLITLQQMEFASEQRQGPQR